MVRPLDYGAGLSVEQAEERYREVAETFAQVKKNYTGVHGMFKENLREEDNQTLVQCTGVLLPLSLEKSVLWQWNEIIKAKKMHQDTALSLHERIAYLQAEILLYVAKFTNTDVKVVRGSLFD